MKFTLRLMALPVAFVALSAHLALAEGPPQGYPPPQQQPPPGYPVQQAQPPLYPTPLQQQTQTTYVPQSVALSGPSEISDYDDRFAPPAGYTPVQRTRKGLIIGGSITFGVSYALCVLTAAVGHDLSDGGENEVAALWVPVLGPFLQMANTSSATANVFLAGLGAAQVAGTVMLITGITRPRTVLVRNDLVSIEAAPIIGPGMAGVMLGGTFKGL